MTNERFILPNSAETSCELWLEGQKVEIKFFSSDGKNLGSKSFLIVALKEDDIVNHLASADVNFTTFSALYDGAGIILEKVQELKESGGESDRKVVLRRKSEPEEDQEGTVEKEEVQEAHEEEVPVDLKDQPLSFETRDLGKIIHYMTVPYTKDVFLFVFQVTRLAYTLVFEQTNKEVYRAELKRIPEETDVYPVLQNSDLPALENMSVIYDIAEAVSKACKNADSFAKEVPEDIQKRVELSRDLSKFAKKVEKEEEMEVEEKGEAEAKEEVQTADISGYTYLLTFKVPYSESSVDFYYSEEIVLAVFKKEETEVSRKEITGIPTEDEGYTIVDESGITDTFSSMGLIYDVSEKIVEVCSDPKKFIPEIKPKEEEVESVEAERSQEEIISSQKPEEVVEEVVDEETLKLKAIVESGELITELKIPYSHETSVKIYLDKESNQFVLRFWRGEKEVDLIGVDKTLDEDGAWEVLNKANIEFISMSVIYDAAEDILKVLANPDDYKKVESAESEESFETVGGVSEEGEEDQTIDYSKYTKPEDIEALLAIIKKSIGKSKKPILIMESEIKTMPKVGFKVLRQGEQTWLLDFYSTKDGSTLSQRPAKLKAINSDEVFKAVNNGIPQVTLSAVSDASEFVFDIIKHLADRPADDLAFNQVVAHFEKLINKHEEAGEVTEAIDLTEGLMVKLGTLENASGYSKFGLKMAKLLESQDKTADSAKLRLEIIPKLIQMRDLQSLRDFVDDTVALFAQNLNRPLDAAQVSVDYAETVLKRKDLTLAMKYIKEASTYYKEANISRALADHNFRFSKLYLQILRDDQPEGFFDEEKPTTTDEATEDDNVENLADSEDPFAYLGEDPFAYLEEESLEEQAEETSQDQKEAPAKAEFADPLQLYDIKAKTLQTLLDDTVELFKGTLEVFEQSREINEKIDTLTEIILLYRKYKFLNEEILFADMGVDVLQQNGQADRALRLALQSIEKLLVKDGDITKGLEFFNDAVKMYYDKQQVKSALDLAISILPKLIDFGEEETTLQYVGFASGILDRIYPEPVEEALSYYLQIAQFYATLKKQQESLALLGKAILFKQKNIPELLEFCHEYSVKYLATKDWDVARDFINSALNVIGANDYPTLEKVSYQFFKDLASHGNLEMGMQYLTYAYQLTGQLSDPLNAAGTLIIDAMNQFLSIEDIKNIKDYFNPLLPILKAYYTQTQKYADAKTILEPVIDRFIQNQNWQEAIDNTKDLATYLQYGQQLPQAGELYISVRNRIFDHANKDVIREFTDTAIKLLVNEYPETQDKGIEILEPFIEYLLKNNEFSDAYVYTVQAVKYFEVQKKIFEATEFIKDKQGKFADKNRHQDVNSLSDLIIRLNKQAADLGTVADIAYKSYQENLSTKNWEACYGYLTESANIYLKMGDTAKAQSILEDGFDIFIDEPDAEDETDELISELVKFNVGVNAYTDEQVLEFYKTAIAKTQKSQSYKLMNKVITKAITLIKEKFPNRFYEEITGIIANLFKAELYKDSQPYVSDLIASYSHDLNFIRDLLFYYVKEFLKGNEVEIAQKLVELVLEKSKGDSGNIIRITMRFVQMLAEYRLSGQARSYIDKIVQNLFPTTNMDQTQNMAVATIYDKFSTMVVHGSSELAIEYGYKAADLYKKSKNYDKLIDVYTHLSSEIDEEETVRSILKRATLQADQIKIPFAKQYHLQAKLIYKNFETRAPTSEREFVQVLGRFEKESMLKESATYLQESFYRMIRNNEFDLFYKYIEYLITLVTGLKSSTKGEKVLVQLAARYYNRKGDKKKVAKLKTIYDSIDEPNPSDELLAHFLRTGELELPPESIKPAITEEMKEVVTEIKEKAVPLEAEEIKAKVETTPEVAKVTTKEPEAAEITVKEPEMAKVTAKEPEAIQEVAEPVTSEEIVQSVTKSIEDSKVALEEVDKSASSLEDELLEIGGDALSQALADAISQLSATEPLEEEPVEEKVTKKTKKEEKKEKKEKKVKEKPKKEEKKEKAPSEEKPMYQSGFGQMPKASSSMDLSNFDSLAELAGESRGTEPRPKEDKGKLASLNPNDSSSLENLFSSALSDLSQAFGMADVPSEDDDKDKKKDKKKKK